MADVVKRELERRKPIPSRFLGYRKDGFGISAEICRYHQSGNIVKSLLTKPEYEEISQDPDHPDQQIATYILQHWPSAL
jgi:hypothetical protein